MAHLKWQLRVLTLSMVELKVFMVKGIFLTKKSFLRKHWDNREAKMKDKIISLWSYIQGAQPANITHKLSRSLASLINNLTWPAIVLCSPDVPSSFLMHFGDSSISGIISILVWSGWHPSTRKDQSRLFIVSLTLISRQWAKWPFVERVRNDSR